MKSFMKKILILIPIGLMLVSGSVRATDVYGTTYLTSAPLDFVIEFDYLPRKPKKMYFFTLNGTLAFCLDPDRGMNSNLTYKYVSDIETYYAATPEKVTAMKKAWVFNKKYGNNYNNGAGQMLSQFFMWNADAGLSYDTGLSKVIEQMVKFQYGDAGYAVEVATIRGMMQTIKINYSNISTSDIDGVKLYVWEYAGEDSTAFQKLITSEPGTPIDTDDEECEIGIINNLASCSNDGENEGSIQEYATSNACLRNTYTGVKSNFYGNYVADYGSYCKLYCLNSLAQTYPGNVSTAVGVGRYLVWPNNNISNNKYKINANLAEYPMKITLSQTCKMLVDKTNLTADYKTLLDAMNGAKTYSTKGDMQTAYLKDGCADLNSKTSSAWSALQSANNTVSSKKSSLDSCQSNITEREVKSCVDKITGASLGDSCGTNRNCYCETTKEPVYPDCSTQEREHSLAKQAQALALLNYEAAKAKSDACADYGAKYQAVKRFLNSFNNTCISATLDNNLDFGVNAFVSYTDPAYGNNGTSKFDLEVSSSNKNTEKINILSGVSKLGTDPLIVTNKNVSDKADTINASSQITASITKTLDLAEKGGEYYYYIDKLTNKSVSIKPSSNYSTIGFSNMPISYNASKSEEYDLTLSVNITTGTAFDSKINNQSYSCSYRVKDDSDCKCPEDSEKPGQSLDAIIKYNNDNGANLTCADAQQKYCYSTINNYCYYDGTYYYGIDGNKVSKEVFNQQCGNKSYCPSPNEDIEITGCINSGSSYNYCVSKFCPSAGNLKCPDDQTGDDPMSEEYRDCVAVKVGLGYDIETAKKLCYEKCEVSGGKKIIYRTISLQNPFPGYSALKTSRIGLTIGMFNDTVAGRYPGTNWNGVQTVKSKILNNRNVDGDAVYSKEPLYTIILDGQAIQTIRNYNDSRKTKGSYADFNLSCKLNNSSACISNFLRDYNLISSGTCKNISNSGSNFYTCDN